MTQPVAAAPEVGLPIEAIDTPALWVDLDALEHNVAVIAGRCAEAGVQWRPHVKASKSPDLAHRVIEGGAVGITCAKLGEAEVMADGGVEDILIANEIVGAAKIARLVTLAGRVRHLGVAVDDGRNLSEIAEGMASAGAPIDVLVDINVGANRCGVTPQQAPALARLAVDLERSDGGVRLRGLMGYEGHAVGVPDLEEKEAVTAQAADVFAEARRQVEATGIEVGVMSGAGTGNYWLAIEQGALTELQAGGGVLLDRKYAEEMHVRGHEHALFVQAQIISTATGPGRAIGDAGWKTTGMHTGLPKAIAPEGVEVIGLNAEHTILAIEDGVEVTPGDRITMVPAYSDSTVLLHRMLYAVRDGTIEAVWPIAGAGMLR